jgi:tRNA(Ile)-lysidine synthase
MPSMRERFDQALDRLIGPTPEDTSPARVLIAVSGGPDSIALLDLFAEVAPERRLELRVVHFDHGIDPESAAVADRVRELAERYRLPFELGSARLGPGASETLARRERLRWFQQVLSTHQPALLATAHHADDQIETMLMRFLRGSGPSGLAGIAERRGSLIRPLLRIERAELAERVARIGIRPWIDPANRDPSHLRAWLRNEVIPLLAARLPDLRRRLQSAREVFEKDRLAWESVSKELPGLDFRSENGAVSVAASPLGGYSSTVVRSVLKAVGRAMGLRLDERAVDRMQALLAQGDTGRQVDLLRGAKAELTFGRLRLFVPAGHHSAELVIESPAGSVETGPWLVSWDDDVVPGALDRAGYRTWIDAQTPLTVRRWRPGDRVRPLRGKGARLVVRCMQDEKVPRSRRSDWLVVEHGGNIVWVPGVCRSELLVPAPGMRARRIDVRPS